MRITGGKLRGRTLRAPRGSTTRPTSDRVRESLFQHLEAAVLSDGFDGLAVLDLFAGSGALSFEAISRGAARALLVDQNRASIRVIQQNVDALKLGDVVTMLKRRLPAALESSSVDSAGPFDIVLCDPPYAWEDASALLAKLGASSAVSHDAICTFEHDARTPPTIPDAWSTVSVRDYGDTAIHVLRRVL